MQSTHAESPSSHGSPGPLPSAAHPHRPRLPPLCAEPGPGETFASEQPESQKPETWMCGLLEERLSGGLRKARLAGLR